MITDKDYYVVCTALKEHTRGHMGSAPLMPSRYAEAPRGQCEVSWDRKHTCAQTSVLYPHLSLKCGQIRDHRLFMPLTKSAA